MTRRERAGACCATRLSSPAGQVAEYPPQPVHVDDFNEMPNDGSPLHDHGGVHDNSGIPNHAYYLMVRAIGRDAAEAIVYRALTEELGPG